MKRLIAALVLTSAFLLLVACGGDEPAETTPTTAPTIAPTTASATSAAPPASDTTPAAQSATICGQGTKPAYLTDLVLAKNTDGDNFTPVDLTDEFEPSQIINAVVSLQDAPGGLNLDAKWYLLQAEGYTPNALLDQTTVENAAGTRNVRFTLQTVGDPFPPGAYCVEIYAAGNLALSKQFRVIGDATPSNASIDVVRQVVLAENAEGGTFTPINPTTTFKSDAPAIHATVEIVDAPPNTKFTARWYPPTQDPLNFDVNVDGSRWIDFRLTPTPTGFPTGQYQVEILVNDRLAKTVEFTVE